MIQFPQNTYEVIDAIRGAIGRKVEFVRDIKTECSVCSLDPNTDTSTDPFCVVCSGRGYIHTFSGVSISGHITWNPSETMQWVPAGTYLNYDCRVQIAYTPANISVLDTVDYLVVDGKHVKISNTIMRGVPEINRILLNCNEE